MHKLHVIISGKVQGVFYRDFIQKNANALGITGWVRNNPDGTVEVVAEGEKTPLESLLEKCKEGPGGAVATNVQVEWTEGTNEFRQFDVT